MELTEELKMQIMAELAKSGAIINQINFGNGTQKFYMNRDKDNKQDAYEDDVVDVDVVEIKDENTNNDAASFSQSNMIFNSQIFKEEKHYVWLRDTILSFVIVDEATNDEDCRIKAEAQNEWYYIMKGVKEAEVVSRSNFTMTKFVEQMLAWFPELFIKKEGEDEDKMVRRYMSSISRENKKWIAGMDKHEVKIKDMWAHQQTRGYDRGWTMRVRSVADGLKKKLVELKTEIEIEHSKK